jgi:alpha-tubulin suppressor-like RCC1 family protein
MESDKTLNERLARVGSGAVAADSGADVVVGDRYFSGGEEGIGDFIDNEHRMLGLSIPDAMVGVDDDFGTFLAKAKATLEQLRDADVSVSSPVGVGMSVPPVYASDDDVNDLVGFEEDRNRMVQYEIGDGEEFFELDRSRGNPVVVDDVAKDDEIMSDFLLRAVDQLNKLQEAPNAVVGAEMLSSSPSVWLDYASMLLGAGEDAVMVSAFGPGRPDQVVVDEIVGRVMYTRGAVRSLHSDSRVIVEDYGDDMNDFLVSAYAMVNKLPVDPNAVFDAELVSASPSVWLNRARKRLDMLLATDAGVAIEKWLCDAEDILAGFSSVIVSSTVQPEDADVSPPLSLPVWLENAQLALEMTLAADREVAMMALVSAEENVAVFSSVKTEPAEIGPLTLPSWYELDMLGYDAVPGNVLTKDGSAELDGGSPLTAVVVSVAAAREAVVKGVVAEVAIKRAMAVRGSAERAVAVDAAVSDGMVANAAAVAAGDAAVVSFARLALWRVDSAVDVCLTSFVNDAVLSDAEASADEAATSCAAEAAVRARDSKLDRAMANVSRWMSDTVKMVTCRIAPVTAGSTSSDAVYASPYYSEACAPCMTVASGLHCYYFIDTYGRLMCSGDAKSGWKTVKYAGGMDEYGRVRKKEFIPIVDVDGIRFRSIVSGRACSLAITDAGDIYSWGSVSFYMPTRLRFGARSFVSVSAGRCHCLAVTEHGDVYGWGDNGSGQCGHHVSVNVVGLGYADNDAFSVKMVREPRVIEGLADVRVRSASAGDSHSMVVSRNGSVFSFGDNFFGQLGRSVSCKVNALPYIVRGGIDGVNICCVCAGSNHSLALSSSGMVFSWGSNRFGQLGNGCSEECRKSIHHPVFAGAYTCWHGCENAPYFDKSAYDSKTSPVVVEALRNIKTSFIAVSDEISASVDGSTGRLFTWGCGRNGRLGHGASADGASGRLLRWGGSGKKWRLGHERKNEYNDEFNYHMVPKLVVGLRDESVLSVCIGVSHTIAVVDDGRVFGWGHHRTLVGFDSVELPSQGLFDPWPEELLNVRAPATQTGAS